MDLEAVQILPISQGDVRSLEEHTQDILDLVYVIHYNDDSLCVCVSV